MSYVRDLFVLTGSGLALWGIYQWSLPLACIVGGVGLVACAVLWTMTTRRDAK